GGRVGRDGRGVTGRGVRFYRELDGRGRDGEGLAGVSEGVPVPVLDGNDEEGAGTEVVELEGARGGGLGAVVRHRRARVGERGGGVGQPVGEDGEGTDPRVRPGVTNGPGEAPAVEPVAGGEGEGEGRRERDAACVAEPLPEGEDVGRLRPEAVGEDDLDGAPAHAHRRAGGEGGRDGERRPHARLVHTLRE